MRKRTIEILSKPFKYKPISGLSKPFTHQKLGPIPLYGRILQIPVRAHPFKGCSLCLLSSPLSEFQKLGFGPNNWFVWFALHGLAQVWTPVPHDEYPTIPVRDLA